MPQTTQIFVSYSRKDLPIVATIVQGLKAYDRFRVAIDTEDILPAEEWQKRLGDLISEADSVIFCLSPASVSSDICEWEVARATALNKRIIPIVVRDTAGSAPGILSKLNYIYFGQEDAFEIALSKLICALDTDVNWVREHTRLGLLATRWQRASRPVELLLRGADVAAADQWASFRSATAPEPTEVLLEFIGSSRAQALVEERLEAERLARQEIEEQQRRIILESEERRKRLRTYAAVIIFVLIASLVIEIADPPPVKQLRLSTFDMYQKLSPRAPDPSMPVRIVAIDEASLERVGQWPWPRSRIAEIIERLNTAGAKTITIPILFSEPDRFNPSELLGNLPSTPALAPLFEYVRSVPSNDERLANAISRAPVILSVAGQKGDSDGRHVLAPPLASYGISGDDPKLFAPSYSRGIGNLALLAGQAKGTGAANLLLEDDNTIRRFPLLVAIGGYLYPSLPLEAMRVARGAASFMVYSSNGIGGYAYGQKLGINSVDIGRWGYPYFTGIPTDWEGFFWLKYSPADERRYISAYQVLGDDFDHAGISGRHVVIAPTALGLDYRVRSALGETISSHEIITKPSNRCCQGSTLCGPTGREDSKFFS